MTDYSSALQNARENLEQARTYFEMKDYYNTIMYSFYTMEICAKILIDVFSKLYRGPSAFTASRFGERVLLNLLEEKIPEEVKDKSDILRIVKKLYDLRDYAQDMLKKRMKTQKEYAENAIELAEDLLIIAEYWSKRG